MQENKSKKHRITSEEGDIFLVPIRPSGFAVGLIARKKGPILLGYFWGTRIPTDDSKMDFTSLKKEDAILVKQFGVLGLSEGEWPIVGKMPGFDKEKWEVPLFRREVSFVGNFAIRYNDRLEEIEMIHIPEGDDGTYPKDGLAGYGWIELRLSRLIDETNK